MLIADDAVAQQPLGRCRENLGFEVRFLFCPEPLLLSGLYLFAAPLDAVGAEAPHFKVEALC
ncbi:hypothetical protein [Methylocystis sp. SB2]|uniref:hypothetical protein n=1 Tax=Methylocystis sp. (strain SB2) TaxID=743836 RepID=UPI0004A3A3AA|nr:hypothetical protein [Methylocystis sp. SB2]ULO23767.1 hypothetical protein LNB28_16860 [Methylocystis sp. SB2]